MVTDKKLGDFSLRFRDIASLVLPSLVHSDFKLKDFANEIDLKGVYKVMEDEEFSIEGEVETNQVWTETCSIYNL